MISSRSFVFSWASSESSERSCDRSLSFGNVVLLSSGLGLANSFAGGADGVAGVFGVGGITVVFVVIVLETGFGAGMITVAFAIGAGVIAAGVFGAGAGVAATGVFAGVCACTGTGVVGVLGAGGCDFTGFSVSEVFLAVSGFRIF